MQDVEVVINEWGCNPFRDDVILKSLQLGQVADSKLINDFESDHSDGANSVKKYLNQRIFSNIKSFYNSFSRKKLYSFANPPQSDAANTKEDKTEETENRAFAAKY